MDMILYALLKKELQNFEYVSGYKIVVVSELPANPDKDTIYIINPEGNDD